MDNQLVWQDAFNIGVETIDKEHQRLFKIINKLFSFTEEDKKNQWACQEGIKYFKGHAVKHFADEEAYMDSIHYEGAQRHKKIHESFRTNTLPALERELEKSGYTDDAVDHFLGVCAGWLIGHTMVEDRAITGECISRWVNLLPEQELEALKKVIIQLVFDMFHLESQVVADAYGGERFGLGVYYRLAYETPKEKKRQEVVLVFEEKLLINTVGKVMGLQSNKLDGMLVHAARHTAQQFVGRVMEHMGGEEPYVLQEENLLTFDQFRQVFETEKPQVSLLFDTGAGYFAYCAIAPQQLHTEVGTLIENENAMSEVEKYLMRREADESRRKVLVVDDSMTIRKGMQQLLGEDYEVTLVDSGVAAIRAISLNRPNLVLLDYEMPVCDGRQTLEMLRSVQDFADIPVMFLTGRRDPQSMIQVMSLKPAGYLLKTLKPAEIKEKIDAFFAEKRA